MTTCLGLLLMLGCIVFTHAQVNRGYPQDRGSSRGSPRGMMSSGGSSSSSGFDPTLLLATSSGRRGGRGSSGGMGGLGGMSGMSGLGSLFGGGGGMSSLMRMNILGMDVQALMEMQMARRLCGGGGGGGSYFSIMCMQNMIN